MKRYGLESIAENDEAIREAYLHRCAIERDFQNWKTVSDMPMQTLVENFMTFMQVNE